MGIAHQVVLVAEANSSLKGTKTKLDCHCLKITKICNTLQQVILNLFIITLHLCHVCIGELFTQNSMILYKTNRGWRWCAPNGLHETQENRTHDAFPVWRPAEVWLCIEKSKMYLCDAVDGLFSFDKCILKVRQQKNTLKNIYCFPSDGTESLRLY